LTLIIAALFDSREEDYSDSDSDSDSDSNSDNDNETTKK
jgi:hypothetical protein